MHGTAKTVLGVTLTIERFLGDAMGMVAVMRKQNEPYTDEGIARRRDEVIKRMLSTPPQPRAKKPKERPVRKGRVHKAKSRS
jgi:hypothetical protein